jgi:SAM-dependent methyltransferase
MIDSDLRYVQCTAVGAEYVRQISELEADRRARSAFQNLVLSLAPPGAALFDFGAGPGLDARFFAEHGFTVEAYDVDPRMRDFFANHCKDAISSGRVSLRFSTYRDFVTRVRAKSERCADLVISNFAPLNVIDDLGELFGRFHSLTTPNGKVLASVLNPCFMGDLTLRSWWRSAPRLWREGQLFLPGPQAPHYRRLLSYLRKVSEPHFRLSHAFRGGPTAGRGLPMAVDLRRKGRFTSLQAAGYRYLFLLFEKQTIERTHRP